MGSRSLFQSVSKNNTVFKNRIVMAPMTRSRAIGSIPNDLMAEYYAQRSSAGLLITEGNSPSPNGLGYARTPGIFSHEQIQGWKKVVKAVHQNDGKIFTQLMHVGRVAHTANTPEGAKVLAPSAVQANGDMWTDTLGLQPKSQPAAMTKSEIEQTISEFVQGAKNAIEAGFDGIELHGANGYLLEQFLNPHTNQRTDEYGGSVVNRIRFVRDLTEAVSNAIGKEKLGVRLSPFSTFNDMPLYGEIVETYQTLARELAKLDILYLHVVEYAANATPEGRELVSSLRDIFPNIFILNGGYTTERAEQSLNEKGADLISFGSLFISNPDLPLRLKHNLEITAPDVNTFYTADEKGYTDYPFAEVLTH